MSRKIVTTFFNVKPLMLTMKAVTFGVALGALSFAGVSFFVALPWSLLVAACITFTFDE